MISGSFHTTAQEWRYYSREKSLIHTLHLAQLASSRPGDTVLIAATPPTTNPKGIGFSFPPFQLPAAPYFDTKAAIVTNSSLIIDCYGSTNYLGQITAQSKMDIHVTPSQITMTPAESGFFVVHAEAQADMHTLNYQGAGGDGQLTVQLLNGGQMVAQSIWHLFMVGQTATHYIDRLPRTSCEALVAGGGSMTALGINIGAQPPGYLSMWAFKVADF